MSLYKEILLDHFKNPRYYDRGQIDQTASFVACESNPLCGDFIQIKGIVADGKLQDAVFSGKGCVISQGLASLLLDQYITRAVQEILDLTSADILALVGMDLGPNRIKCALLALIALQNGLKAC